MQMNHMTMQTYVADHRARLIAEAHRTHRRHGRVTLGRLLARTRRQSRPAELQPQLAPTPCP